MTVVRNVIYFKRPMQRKLIIGYILIRWTIRGTKDIIIKLIYELEEGW